jgi:hypothetical protein
MSKPTLEFRHPTLTGLKELAQVRQKRLEGCENGLVVFQLISELAAAPEALPRLEMTSRIGVPACQSIQFTQLRRAKATCKPRTRQT